MEEKINKEVCIVPPKGYEIDKDKSTFEKIVFKKAGKLPKYWRNLETVSGFYVESDCGTTKEIENAYANVAARNIFPTKEEAKASIALAQLCQLRNRYNDGWIPDYSNGEQKKYIIYYFKNKLSTFIAENTHWILVFKSAELRDKFFITFKDLLKIAKPFL